MIRGPVFLNLESLEFSGKAALVALALLFPIALSGCMSSGVSSFADGVVPSDNASQNGNSMQEIPLAVASSGVMDLRGEDTNNTQPIDLPTQDSQTHELAIASDNDAAIENNDLMRTASVEPQLTTNMQALAPETEALRGRTELELASIAPDDSIGPDGLAGDAEYQGMSDPAEMAAAERAENLYASIDHGFCKGGWGPKPKVLNATRMTPGHPYYMEMRMRHTPMLPVGHVYIAYGHLSPDGKPLDEKLVMLAPVGGYVGAGIAGAVPMPGVMKPLGDDCWVKPEASYRISLTAQKYEKLLLAIQDAKRKKPTYSLFAYNCNHFMSSLAKSVGILPPENIYTPSLVYFYEMMDRNEGYKVARNASELAKMKRNAPPAISVAQTEPVPTR
jgi:hypothetical protein